MVHYLHHYHSTETERERDTDRQTDRQTYSKLTGMSTKTLSRIKELSRRRRSSRLRNHVALRRSLTTLTSVLLEGQLLKCTGERRYGSSCIQPYIIFGAGTRIVPEQKMCQPLRYLVLGRTVGRLRSQQAKVLAREIEKLLFFIQILILQLIVVNQFDMWIKSENI